MALPDPLTATDGPNLESAASGIHWGSILGGAAVAAAISLILLPLGSALGFASFSVFTATTASAVTFTAGWAIWLVIMQWASAGVGGYIAGRLRVKWADTHSDEVFFRDTAHGFIAWSVASLLTIGLVALAGIATLGASARVAENAVAPVAYYADSLYRTPTPAATASNAELAVETARILGQDTVSGEDRTYLASQVAARTGLTQQAAEARVNTTLVRIDADKQKAAEVAEAARKTMVAFHIGLFLSLLVGAFIACVSAALGGKLRDNY